MGKFGNIQEHGPSITILNHELVGNFLYFSVSKHRFKFVREWVKIVPEAKPRLVGEPYTVPTMGLAPGPYYRIHLSLHHSQPSTFPYRRNPLPLATFWIQALGQALCGDSIFPQQIAGTIPSNYLESPALAQGLDRP